jgi:PI31 proteasome regulator N-terminal
MVQQNTAGNPLAAGSLASFMAASIPKDRELKSSYDAVALAVHAGMIAVGFNLKGLGEDHRIGTFL